MRPGAECPDPTTLDAFVNGRLPVEQRPAIEEHLEGCTACRRTAVRLISHATQPVEYLSSTPGSLPIATGAELRSGEKVGRHIVIDRLGAGGMGTVYAAYDTTLERKIALKFLARAPSAEADTDQLLAEASAMAQLSHPNVVTVHDVGTHAGQPYLAMEYVDGQTLGQWRSERPRSVRQILDVMAAVAQGLEAAHNAGLIHRDVKPHNVLVSGRRVVVTDFGLSVRSDAGRTATAAGTPAYMAPEQLAGAPATRATDVFSFSVTLYELLYGQHPFGGGDPSGQVRPSPPGARVPRHVQRLVVAGLALDPAARPAGMGVIATALLDDPARRRRRAGAAVLAAGAVAGAFWVGGYVKADPGRRCRAGAAVMDGVWSDQRQQQLAGSPQAGASAAAWQTLVRRFDEYATAWRAMFSDTCQAAFTDRRISGELFDLRMNCLDGHRASFAAVLGSLPGASAAQLQKLAASPLPAVAECGINEGLSARPLPADPASRARVARINETLAQVDAARSLGDFARARRLATEARAAARSLGYQPLEARAINKLASVELRGIKLSGNSPGTPASLAADRAIVLLEEAIAVAEAGRDDGSRAEAATQLVVAHRDAGRLAEAERWAEQASAIVKRVGDPPLYRSSVEYARGWVQYDRQERDAAEASFARSLLLRQRQLGPRAPEVLASKTATCGVMARDERIKCYREVIALAQTIAGPRHPDLATIKANLAYVLVDDAAKRDEACQLATEAVDIERNAVEANHIGLLRAMLALAQCRRDQGRIKEARSVYVQAIEYASHPTSQRGDLLADYGAFLAMQGDQAQAIAYRRKSVADHELVYGPTHQKPIETRQRIADTLRRQGKLLEALKEADEAIAICDRAGAMPLTYPELYEVKGLTLMDMKKLEPASRALLHSVELHEKLKTPEWNRGFTLVALGQVEARLGKLDQAIAHLEKAMRVFTMESDPIYHGATALVAANAMAKKGRASWPRACELGRRALTGYSHPSGGSMAEAIAETKKFLAAHRCGSNS
jgi:eukaryotic-like serine/threonine-protein kinase